MSQDLPYPRPTKIVGYPRPTNHIQDLPRLSQDLPRLWECCTFLLSQNQPHLTCHIPLSSTYTSVCLISN